jgi:hypothetical protein
MNKYWQAGYFSTGYWYDKYWFGTIIEQLEIIVRSFIVNFVTKVDKDVS